MNFVSISDLKKVLYKYQRNIMRKRRKYICLFLTLNTNFNTERMKKNKNIFFTHLKISGRSLLRISVFTDTFMFEKTTVNVKSISVDVATGQIELGDSISGYCKVFIIIFFYQFTLENE